MQSTMDKAASVRKGERIHSSSSSSSSSWSRSRSRSKGGDSSSSSSARKKKDKRAEEAPKRQMVGELEMVAWRPQA
jgi:hypothetical protein